MNAFRSLLIGIAAIQALFAAGFFFQVPAITGLWPYPGTTPLTNIFLSSIVAAAAASTGWAAITRNYGALAGISLDYMIMLGPLAVYTFLIGSASGGYAGFVIACVIGALFGLGMLIWSVRIPLDTSIPMPALVRWSFALFVVLLVLVSTLLFLRVPNIIPWAITPDLSFAIGLMFIGAAGYFAYGFVRRAWSNAAGQLLGFLAYDVVLIGPFLQRFSVVEPQHFTSLVIYTAVVIYSGLLAIYFLFIHPPTRRRTWLVAPQPVLTGGNEPA